MQLYVGKEPSVVEGIERRRLIEFIGLLAESGAGLEAIASPLTAALRDLVGAVSGSIFWLDAERRPQGFYHDCAPAELKDFFIAHFDELFSDPGETNMLSLTEVEGPSVGRLLPAEVQQWFWDGAVYRHLCVPLGHRYLLDMRIEVDGVGRALFCAWYPESLPFGVAEVERLRQVQPIVARAFQHTPLGARWSRLDAGDAYFVTDAAGIELLSINDLAERVLKESHLLRQNVPAVGEVRHAPGFAIAMARAQPAEAEGEGRQEAEPLTLPVKDGRLVVRAAPVRGRAAGQGDSIVFHLERQAAAETVWIERLMGLPLSPLQRRLALFAAQGGQRAEALDRFEVSPEAMKKHLRAILQATGAASWTELALA